MKKKPNRIKKPTRKEFRREYGPRYNIEFSKAMRKYRKQERESAKAGPKQTSTSRIGRLTDPAALRREARSLTSKKTETVKTPAPVEPKAAVKTTGSSQNTRKPKVVESKKPKPVEPTSKSKKSGVTGKYRDSNPLSPRSSTRSMPSGGGRSGAKRRQQDPRARSVKRNLQEAAAAKARRERKEAFSAPYGGIASRPPANPKEGDMYKRPFGPVMIYKDGRFIRKR